MRYQSKCLAKYLGVIGLLIGIQAGVAAQTPIRSWNPLGFGAADSIPDLDGDGFRELVVGQIAKFTPKNAGSVFALSSLTGQKLYSYSGSPGEYLGIPLITVGDATGDGFPDIASGSIFTSTMALDGRNGSALFQRGRAVTSIASLGDLNGDGLDDVLFATGVASLGFGGSASVYLGGSFELAYEIRAPPPASVFGESSTAMGDVDGDGVPDFAIGAPADYNFAPATGQVYVYSGKDGSLIWEHAGGYLWAFGRGLASPGDLNGDGINDLVVSEGGCCAYPSGPGRLYFFDGPTGAPIAMLDPPPMHWAFGNQVVSAGDVDGNGFGDILVTIVDNATPRSEVWLIDGGTRETIYDLPYRLGPLKGGGLDWDGDDFPDFLNSPYWLELWSGAPVGVRVLGQACPLASDRPPRIGATGVAEIGEDYPIHLSRVRPNVAAFLATGAAPVSRSFLPLVSGRGSACPLLVASSAIYAARTREIRPGEGVATVEVPISNDPSLQGTIFYAQWLVMDEADESKVAASTRMLEIQIQ